MNVTAKIGIVKILDKSYNLCDLVTSLRKECPLDPVAEDRVTITEAIPDISVRYTNLVN